MTAIIVAWCPSSYIPPYKNLIRIQWFGVIVGKEKNVIGFIGCEKIVF